MANKRCLITGVTGFAGSHLAEYLVCLEKPEPEVYGMKRWRSPMENIRHIQNDIKLVEGDLLDLTSLKRIIDEVRPDYIFHLAAQSCVPSSWTLPHATMEVNAMGTLNLLEAVRQSRCDPVIQLACSSEEYGLVHKNETPIKETNPLRPLSSYGVSKVTTDMLGYQYFKSYGMKIIRTRAFNHTGPRRGEVFVCSSFSKQKAEQMKNKRGAVEVGNLNSIRDFTDVRDTVKAYWYAVRRGKPGEVYNICSGVGYTIKDIVDMLGITEYEQVDRLMRPSDVEVLIGDNSKFKNATGWRQKIDLETTLQDLLAYWTQRV